MSILGAIGGVAGSLISGLFGNSQAKKQAALQKQFAQNQIQWKVADAKAAGVHPLAALGVSPMHYSPVSAGVPDIGPALSSLGNAIHRTSDPATRRAIDLGLEKAALENEYLRAQINSIRALRPQSPGIPRPGAGPGEFLSPPPPEYSGLRDNLHGSGVISADPENSDAQRYEDRYGDVLQNVYGIRNWLYDMAYTAGGMPSRAAWELLRMRLQRGRDRGRLYRHR